MTAVGSFVERDAQHRVAGVRMASLRSAGKGAIYP
jgi:hypothetical protein